MACDDVSETYTDRRYRVLERQNSGNTASNARTNLGETLSNEEIGLPTEARPNPSKSRGGGIKSRETTSEDNKQRPTKPPLHILLLESADPRLALRCE